MTQRNNQATPELNRSGRAWHHLPAETVLRELAGDRDKGLSAEAAGQRLKRHGLNLLPQAKRPSPWLRFFSEATSAKN